MFNAGYQRLQPLLVWEPSALAQNAIGGDSGPLLRVLPQERDEVEHHADSAASASRPC